MARGRGLEGRFSRGFQKTIRHPELDVLASLTMKTALATLPRQLFRKPDSRPDSIVVLLLGDVASIDGAGHFIHELAVETD